MAQSWVYCVAGYRSATLGVSLGPIFVLAESAEFFFFDTVP